MKKAAIKVIQYVTVSIIHQHKTQSFNKCTCTVVSNTWTQMTTWNLISYLQITENMKK